MNVCCYLPLKLVREEEVDSLGRENLWFVQGRFYFKNKDNRFGKFSPCVFLDEERRECSIYTKRPETCRRYTCQGLNLEHLIDEVRFLREKKQLG